MKFAIVVSFNIKTDEILFTRFDGDKSAIKAQDWIDKDRFIWRDFPESEGWIHFAWWNKDAGRELGEYRTKQMLGKII